MQAKRGVQCWATFRELIKTVWTCPLAKSMPFVFFWQFQNPHVLFERIHGYNGYFLWFSVFSRVHLQSQSFTSFCLVGSSVHKKGGIYVRVFLAQQITYRGYWPAPCFVAECGLNAWLRCVLLRSCSVLCCIAVRCCAVLYVGICRVCMLYYTVWQSTLY